MVKRLKYVMYKDSWRDLSLFTLEKRRLKRIQLLSSASKAGFSEDQARRLSEVHSSKARDSGQKLPQRKFWVRIRKKTTQTFHN